MASKLSLGIGLGAVGMAIALSTVGNSSAALAQAEPVTVAQYRNEEIDNADLEPLPTIPQAFNRAYYSRRGNYFDNRQIWQSFSLILGIPGFPEQAISRDGRAVHHLYREVLEQQVSNAPILRTPDLPNPYTGSVLTTPLVITEDAIEAAPMFPPIRRSGAAEPAPSAPRPAAPIPALW